MARPPPTKTWTKPMLGPLGKPLWDFLFPFRFKRKPSLGLILIFCTSLFGFKRNLIQEYLFVRGSLGGGPNLGWHDGLD